MLSGHGSFGDYLVRIGKIDSAMCPFCGLEEDSSDHTLSSCPAWFDERSALTGVIGPDLSLEGVIRAITSNRESWLAFARFAESVMRAKEDAERLRKAAAYSPDPFDPG